MRKVILFFVLSVFLCLCAGCMSMTYKPEVALGLSPETIQAAVQIEVFDDLSPDEDKKLKALGWSAAHPRNLAGNMAVEITDAVLRDFRNNRLFIAVEKRIENPDVIIKGKINRFYGKAGPMLWTVPIDILWFFGLPMESVDSGVDIEISLYSAKGGLIGNYRGKAEYSEYHTIYNSTQTGIGAVLNNNFSKAMQEIRVSILKDEQKIFKFISVRVKEQRPVVKNVP
jgi:hypothetical protein